MQKHEDRTEPGEGRQRRAYEPPRVVETGEFETLALQCGKLPPPATFSCAMDPSQS
jgi:hypothetical protein